MSECLKCSASCYDGISEVVCEKCYAALLTANAAMREALARIATECNCRAEHGAEGAEHLFEMEKRIHAALAAAPVAPAITHERVRQLCGWYDRLCELLRAGGSDEVAGLSCAIHELRREMGV